MKRLSIYDVSLPSPAKIRGDKRAVTLVMLDVAPFDVKWQNEQKQWQEASSSETKVKIGGKTFYHGWSATYRHPNGGKAEFSVIPQGPLPVVKTFDYVRHKIF